jgi:hypothetical protein
MFDFSDPRRGQARRLHALPWKKIPVIHRDDDRGHGRHEQRLVQVVTADGLLCPHAAQVLRIQRRRFYGAKKWSSETVHAITDLPPCNKCGRDRLLSSRTPDCGKHPPPGARYRLRRRQTPGQDP